MCMHTCKQVLLTPIVARPSTEAIDGEGSDTEQQNNFDGSKHTHTIHCMVGN